MDPPSAGSVPCPTCGADVSVSLPRSATKERVTATPDRELEEEVEDDPRTRCLTFVCSADHEVHVYFVW
jgi:uncharacterized Zn finger protein (UPF0148 family)